MAPKRIVLKRILCPVDFSEFSSRALEHAVRLADLFSEPRARIEALHVVPYMMAGPDLPYFPAPVEETQVRHKQAEKELRDLVAPFAAKGVAIDIRVREGVAWREITAEIQELPADLVVMGTHGRSGFEHLLLGSVTEKVLRRATCPVLTVGNGPLPSRTAPLFRRILCATDLTEASPPTLDLALSLAEEGQAELILLHVIESLSDQGEGAKLYLAVPEIGPLRRVLTERAKERLSRAVPEEARDWCSVRERVKVGCAWRAIVRLAKEAEADLIVVGAHAHVPTGRLFLGATASHVVREAQCPVIVARQAPVRRPAQDARVRPVAMAAGGKRARGESRQGGIA